MAERPAPLPEVRCPRCRALLFRGVTRVGAIELKCRCCGLLLKLPASSKEAPSDPPAGLGTRGDADASR